MRSYQLKFPFRMPSNTRIVHAGRMFARLRFSQFGIPPGTTAKILSDPERYWRKKIGDGKVFYEPLGLLRKIHDRFALYLENNFRKSNCYSATAYWRGTSIIRNAQPHKENSSSLCLDAYNAFESVKTKHIFHYLLRTGAMLYGPYDPDQRAQAWVISRLITYRGKLRKGSPVSPFIFNLLFDRLDDALLEALSFSGIVYSRYADDFCFSSPENEFPDEVETVIRRVLREHHIVLNEKKTCRSGNGVLEFPGVVVIRGKVRPQGAYIAKLAKCAESLSNFERKGHRDFLHQFGRGGVPRKLKALLH